MEAMRQHGTVRYLLLSAAEERASRVPYTPVSGEIMALIQNVDFVIKDYGGMMCQGEVWYDGKTLFRALGGEVGKALLMQCEEYATFLARERPERSRYPALGTGFRTMFCAACLARYAGEYP